MKVSWWTGAVRISGGGLKNKQLKVRVTGLCSRGTGRELPQHRDLRLDQDAPVPPRRPPRTQIHRPEQQEHPANPELAQRCREVSSLCVWSIDLFSCISRFVITRHYFAWAWWSAPAYHSAKQWMSWHVQTQCFIFGKIELRNDTGATTKYSTVQKFKVRYFISKKNLWKNFILLFSKDALNWSKLKTFIMLQKTSLWNKCCYFELSFFLKNPEKNVSRFSAKLIIIFYVSWAQTAYFYDFWRIMTCDTEYWCKGSWKLSFAVTGHFKYIQIENIYFKLYWFFHNITVLLPFLSYIILQKNCAVKRLNAINRIQNKVCLHNICMCTVYLLCIYIYIYIYKYTHKQYIFWKYLHVFIYLYYI